MRQTAEKSQRYHLWAVAQLLTFTSKKKPRNGANLQLRHALQAGGVMSFDINGFLIFHEFWSQQSDVICLQSIFSVKERGKIDMSLS